MTDAIDSRERECFGVLSAILLLLLWAFLGVILALIQFPSTKEAMAVGEWCRFTIPPTAIVLFCSGIARPRLLLLSNWRLTWRDVPLTMVPPILLQAIPMFFARDAAEYFSFFGSASLSTMFCVAAVGPVLEELFCRGFILRSLALRTSRLVALLIVSVVVSLIHPAFWEALPRQIMISLVYFATGNSLTASILCHIILNSFVFLPIGDFFQRWHVYTIWK
jgi:membrane protease YdiL (CAAX protease family)